MGYWAKDGSYVREEGDGPKIVPEPVNVAYNQTDERYEKDEVRELERMGRINEAHKYGNENGISSSSIENLSPELHEYLFRQGVKAEQERQPYMERVANWVQQGVDFDAENFNEIIKKLNTDETLSNKYLTDFKKKIRNDQNELLNSELSKEEADAKIMDLKRTLDDFTRVIISMKMAGHSFQGAYPATKDIERIFTDGSFTSGFSVDNMKIYRKYGIDVKAGIPHDFDSDYYGRGFMARDGYASSVMTDLVHLIEDKDVNWHKDMIYREGELTPAQRYALKQEMKAKQEQSISSELEDMLNDRSIESNTQSKTL